MDRETAKRLITYYYYSAGVAMELQENYGPVMPVNSEFYLGETCGFVAAAAALEKYLRGTWAK